MSSRWILPAITSVPLSTETCAANAAEVANEPFPWPQFLPPSWNGLLIVGVLPRNASLVDTDRSDQRHFIIRTYVQFDVSSIPQNHFVLSAELRFTNTVGPYEVFHWMLTRAWEPSTLTWNSAPPFRYWSPAKHATLTGAGGSSSASLDVTEAVRTWHSGGMPNNGLVLTGPLALVLEPPHLIEAPTVGFQEFVSTAGGSSQNLQPVVVITHVPELVIDHPPVVASPTLGGNDR
jgi:hypothetical protein